MAADHEAQGTTGLRFARTIVDELACSGVTDAVVCPGSRSTALAVALHAHAGIRTHVHLDERSGAFVALGLARATDRPAVVVTTSGTAAVELHPAVVEADLDAVPLLVLTADRPAELRDVGAPQAVDQQHLYGRSLRWFTDPGTPDAATAGTWRSLAARAVVEATGVRPGPVQLNLPFREPLLPEGLAPGDDLPAPEPGRSAGRAWHRRVVAAEPDDDLLDALASTLRGRRGVIVAGGGIAEPDGVHELAEALGWPVVADPRSGCRVPATATISHADAILRHEATAARLRPEAALRLGTSPASKVLGRWLADSSRGHGTWHAVVERSGRVLDADHVADSIVAAEPGALASLLASRVRGEPRPEGWLASWAGADAAAAEAIRAVLSGHDEPTEPAIARDVLAALPDGSSLVVSSSMPVRDLEWWSAPRSGVQVHANRGANGIDGVISTAVGVALAGAPTVALVGDVAMVHDTNGLAGLAGRGVDLTVVVVDNDGGGIFSFLPQAGALGTERFEDLFGTPHGTDLAALAAAHGLATVEPGERSRVGPAVAGSVAEGGVRVVRVRTERSRVTAVHAELHDAVGSALDRG